MRVVVAGGGIAALEALAGLHALAGDRVDATLLAPEPSFSYRPLSTALPFTFREERTRALADVADDLQARFVRDGLAEVDDSRCRVLTHGGDFLPYDALLVAVGARAARGAAPGVRFKRDREGVSTFARLLRDLEDGAVQRVAFVVPRDAAWPVDAYELAFVARRAKPTAKVTLVAAEERPLEALGAAVSEAIGDELDREGIELLSGVEVRDPAASAEGGLDAFSSAIARLTRRDRARAKRRFVLQLEPDSTLVVDRAISLPAVHGPAVAGVAHDRHGFHQVDGHGRVPGSSRLHVAGDATALSLKHSTLASSQATAVAEAIAAEAGAKLTTAPRSPVLYRILTLPPHFTGTRGSAWLEDGEPATHCLWWPPGHVAGRHLGPYLASRDPGVRPGLEWHPNGLPVAVEVGGRGAEAGAVGAPSEDVLRHDALVRQP